MSNATVSSTDNINDGKARLRLWLRLLQSTRLVETELRERLRLEFNITLPRFDVLAALYRMPEGMLMSQLSRYLVVSNGNVTGIIDRLVADKMVVRAQRKGDRRTSIVRLSNQGRQDFEKMAQVHEKWVNELLGDLSLEEGENLKTTLEKIKPGEKSR
jgi:DNA-binding MarR family transcriptional regulator